MPNAGVESTPQPAPAGVQLALVGVGGGIEDPEGPERPEETDGAPADEEDEETGPGEDERVARAALARLAEPGDETVGEWIERFGAREVLRRIERGGELPRRRSGGRDRLANYRVRLAGLDPTGDLDRFRRLGGRLVVPGDAEWPTQLDDLGSARPIALWVRGDVSLRCLALRSVAVVGARASTEYGLRAATELAAGLAQRGWTVVSGAAYGIDAAAHRGALTATGATVAVLACGADRAYPSGNTGLIARIAEEGLLVSELPPGEHPTRSRFVLRNRVIAALTRGTVVVEAACRSGALSTARRAAGLNRQVMGVPGSCFSQLSSGVHQLIRSGQATLVTDPDEVVELVGGVGTDLAPLRHGPVLPRDLLPLEAVQVLEALPAGAEGLPLPEVARRAGLVRELVLPRLFELGALGFAARRGERWSLA
ncbi:DNA-processing protein DprA [Phaeacidiphilus oryzae]|uniref:DNA-processing protein DprA n=1 Tax=Phaeacidiphilus oryzae TaxID=348818 RepID=UPI000A07BB96|nr:DNA-processing protein DprA [Phaeacidiphilus oryzae]